MAGLRVLTAILLSLLAGCGDDAETDRPAAAKSPPPTEAAKAFSDFQELSAGRRYVTGAFKPPIAVQLPEGAWTSEVGDTAEHFAIAAVEPAEPIDQAILGVHRITSVFDPEKGAKTPGDAIRFDGDFAAWLSEHPHLKATEPEPVELLGLEGVQLDVTGRSSPPAVPDDCGKVGDDCVPLLHDGLDAVLYSSAARGRFTVLELPSGGQLVVEQFVEPDVAFDDGLALLAPLLDGLELG